MTGRSKHLDLKGEDEDSGSACAHIVLYQSEGDEDLSLDALGRPPSSADGLLWIDIDCDSPQLVKKVCARLELPSEICAGLIELGSTPVLRNVGEHFCLHSVAVEHTGNLQFEGAVLAIAAGEGYVITVHPRPIHFIAELRQREHGQTSLGQLTSSSFVASLLDWHLATYFDAVSDFERSVETLEEAVLHEGKAQSLEDLRRLRKAASRLRRMLAPHRRLFSSLARPDFRPEEDIETTRHFENIDDHFDKAMDAVENARDLVIGTFELYSNQIALRTNDTMRALTFFTVVIGVLAVIAGALGMNFEAPFFKLRNGFEYALAIMFLMIVAAMAMGRRKKWF